MSTIISLTNGSFIIRYLLAVYSGPFARSRPLPAIPPVFLRSLFRVGVEAFVGCLAVEPGLYNEYSLSYLVPVNDFYIVVDISIRPSLL